MLEQVIAFAPIGKYIVIALGVIGAIMLIYGIYKGEKISMQRGGYMLILAIVLWVSAHLMFNVSEERTEQIIYGIQQQYGY